MGTTLRVKNSRGTQAWRAPKSCEIHLQELNQILLVNIGENALMLPAGGIKGGPFGNMPEHTVLNRPALRGTHLPEPNLPGVLSGLNDLPDSSWCWPWEEKGTIQPTVPSCPILVGRKN